MTKEELLKAVRANGKTNGIGELFVTMLAEALDNQSNNPEKKCSPVETKVSLTKSNGERVERDNTDNFVIMLGVTETQAGEVEVRQQIMGDGNILEILSMIENLDKIKDKLIERFIAKNIL